MSLGQIGYGFVQSFKGNPLLDLFMVIFAEYLALLVPLTGLYIWYVEDDGFEKASFIGATVVLSVLLTYAVGFIYYHKPPQYHGFETILTKELENAFPSQHAAGTFAAVCPTLYLGKRKVAAVLAGGAVLTGIGRVYTGLHFPIDILGGVGVSLLAFSAVYLFEDKLFEAAGRVKNLVEK